MQFLRQSTASQSVVIGPFVDSTDGNTAETGLTISNTDIRLSKNGANIVGKNSGGGTHDELGYYTITLDATDTDTVGRLQLMVHESGALPVYHEYQVLEEAVFDALYASSAVGPLLASTTGSGLSAIPWNASWDAEVQSECTDALNAYDPPTNAEMEARTIASASYATATNLATVDTVVDGIKAVTDALPDAGALTSIAQASALATVDTNVDAILVDTGTTLPASIATIDGNVDAILVDTAEIGAAGAGLTAVPWNAAWDAEVQSECADALTAYDPPTKAELDSAVSPLATSSALATVDSNVDAILVDTGTTLEGHLTDIKGGTFNGSTDSLEAIRDRGDAAWTTGAGGSAPTASEIADAVWDEDLTGHTTTDSAGEILGNVATGTPPSAAAIRAEIDSNSTQLAAIVADTNELQTDWANGGRLDLILDARASQASVDTIDGNVDSILTDTGTTIPGTITTIDTVVDAIKAVTDNLPNSGALSSLATGSDLATVDTVVDAIKAKTDSLTFTQTGQVDANLQSINDVAITGDGSSTPFDVS